jgi:hypothetical protein
LIYPPPFKEGGFFVVDYDHFDYLWFMKKVVKLTEKDLTRIIEKVISEQGTIDLPPKGLKPVLEPSKVAEIKSQADVLSKDTELIKQTLETLKRYDPEAYYMLTRGDDPIKKTVIGELLPYGTIIAMIYGIVQELRGR